MARSPRNLGAVLATGLVLAGTLGACGQAPAAAKRQGAATPKAHLTKVDHRSPPSRRELARLDAARLLVAVRLPPRSRQLAHEPSGDQGLLRSPAQSVGDANLVDLHRFFVARSSPSTVYAYLQSHLPLGARRDGEGTSSVRGVVDEWFVSDSWPAVKTILDSRSLNISIVALPGNRSGIRVDAQVTWLPAKPAGDRIPPGAKVVTAVLSHGLNPGERGHKPVTTTDPAKIAALRAFINQLGVVPPGTFGCPADFGQFLTITFRKSAQDPPLAVVTADVSGCELVQVERSGHVAKPSLWGIGLVPFVERQLGFR